MAAESLPLSLSVRLPCTVTVPTVLLSSTRVMVLPPPKTRLSVPWILPAKVPPVFVVSVPPTPVTMPLEPGSVPVLVSEGTYRLVLVRSTLVAPPLTVRPFLLLRMLLAPERVRVPSLTVVESLFCATLSVRLPSPTLTNRTLEPCNTLPMVMVVAPDLLTISSLLPTASRPPVMLLPVLMMVPASMVRVTPGLWVTFTPVPSLRVLIVLLVSRFSLTKGAMLSVAAPRAIVPVL